MTLSAGDRFDRYLVEALLGRGGMGEVWRAIDPRLDRRIALKILSRRDAFDPGWSEARTRMLREARAAAALDHPNVVAVFDVGEVGETPYIAMELVEGVTLREYIGDARVSTKRRVQWMTEIARALAAAHKRGIVHRDVKPENVMVRGDGALKVLDFGIARRVRLESNEPSAHPASVITRDSAPIGTLMYMSPEQLEGARIDARSDQFAWGVLALELFRGEHPWGEAETPVSLVEAILRAEARPLEESADVPAAFVSAVARATSKRPGERFASMDEILAMLEGDEKLPAARPQLATGMAQIAFASTSGPVTFGELPTARLPFEPGAVVAGHYEIVRLLGRGGMGEVYEAVDRPGGERVALKTVRADRAGERRLLERFRREVELARRVVHPNVVRVLDVCTHTSDADREPILVLAMELLVGESLADHLRRRGPLSIGEAQPIAEQMGSALAAAHAAGVVHRDFKTANVLLETGPGGKRRAVVTDFGLSRAITPGPDDRTLSRDVVLLGTPAYMAPEQIAGGAIDARADVYAFGIVLFEMVTGRLPFSGETPVETAMMRLSQQPPAPRSITPGLHPSWDTAIVRCLAREPDDRFATTSEILAALEAGTRSRRRARTWWGGGMAIAVAALGIAFVAHRERPGRAPSPSVSATPAAASAIAASPPITTRPAVAVWSLFNASGDPRMAWLGAALGEMLRTELSAGEAVRVVPGASIARAQRDLALANSEKSEGGDLARPDVARVAAALGATVLVDGAYVAVGTEGRRRVRVDLHAKDSTGTTLASVAEAGTEDELFELVERAAGELRAAIRVPAAGAASVRMVRAALPASGPASREYAEGTLAMQSLDYALARDHFERAVAIDPTAPLPHAALAGALLAVGYVARAAEEAKAALDRATDVSREDRLVIEAQYLQTIYDRAGCADRWHVLSGFFPDNVEYGLSLARAYLRANEPARAKETIDALRKLPSPVPEDPRLDIVAADAMAGSDFQAMAELAQAALVKARATGSRSLALDAEEVVARANGNLGKNREGSADEYRRIGRAYMELGNRKAAVRAQMIVGVSYARLNDWNAAGREAAAAIEQAKTFGYPDLEAQSEYHYAQVLRHQDAAATLPHLARALEIARKVGDRITEEEALNQRAILFNEKGEYAAARPLFEEAAKIAGAIGAKSEETDALDNLALALEAVGEPKEALSVHERMALRYAETGNRQEQFLALVNVAVVLIDLGDPGGAMTKLDDAAHAGGGAQGRDYDLSAQGTRGRVEALRGNAEAAHTLIQGVIDELRKTGAPGDAEGWEESLWDIDVAAGVSRASELQQLASTGKNASDVEVVANLALSLAIDGKIPEAVASARRAVGLASKEETYVKRSSALLGAADVLARAGHGAEALAIARPIVADAEPRGFAPLVLAGRLVVVRAGGSGAARTAELQSIAHAARDLGLVAFARRVEAVETEESD